MRDRIAVITVVVTMAMAIVAVPAMAQSDQELDQAQTFRRNFDLPSSMAVVKESFANPAKYSDLSHGIPLTPAEDAELDRRQEIVWESGPARELARTLDGYSDVYLDQQRGGVPVFLFTGNLEARRASIAEVMPDWIDFTVEKVEFTVKQLRNKQDKITADMLKTDWVLDGDIQLVQAGYDVEVNRVLVGLVNEDLAVRAREILQDRYGPMVDIEYIGPTEEDACNNRDNCRDPIKVG